MSTISTLNPQTRRNLGVLFVMGLLFWASLASLLPTLPPYVKSLGASNQQLGIVMGSFAIGLLLFRSQMGRLADSRGRKIVLLIGITVAAIAPILHLFTQSISVLMAIRAFHGLSIAAFTTAYSALVVDVSPPQNRGELIGYMSLVNPIGMALGPAIGGYLQEWKGFTPVFVLASCLGVVSLICCSQVQSPPIEQRSNGVNAKTETFWQLLSSDRIRIPTITMLLIGLAFGTLATFVPLYIKESGSDLNPGLFYTSAAIASFVVRFLAGRASDRYGRGPFITTGLACYALSMFLLCIAQTTPAFLIAGFIEGIGGGTFLPITIALVADRCHPHERGRVLGLFMSGFDLGIALAGPFLGVVADRIGYRGAFGVASILALAALIIFLTLCSKNLSRSLRFALGQSRDAYALPKPMAAR
ncbi:MAG: MFS transporter [Phormidesmis sp. CAN_BIN36]|nr:MFS transporter [Phormidesmis sp. CAN_BIN36]